MGKYKDDVLPHHSHNKLELKHIAATHFLIYNHSTGFAFFFFSD